MSKFSGGVDEIVKQALLQDLNKFGLPETELRGLSVRELGQILAIKKAEAGQ